MLALKRGRNASPSRRRRVFLFDIERNRLFVYLFLIAKLTREPSNIESLEGSQSDEGK